MSYIFDNRPIVVFQILAAVQQGTLGDTDFKPIIDPAIVSSTTPSQPPTALPLIQSKPKTNSFQRIRAPIKYEDNVFSESKRYVPKVVRYTKRRDPPTLAPKRTVKRYLTRPRRRPKPSYGPPNIVPINPLNEYSLAGDIYDPAMYKYSGSKKSSSEKLVLPPGVVETDIGKFYDASAMFSASNFKTPYKPFGTSLLSQASLFGGASDYKLGEPNPMLTNSDTSSSGMYPASPGTYPASPTNFDGSNFNLYESQPQMIYPTAPQLPQPNGLPSHIQTQLTLAGPTFGSSSKSKKPIPPSTSYGVPVPPNLSSYAIESSQNSYQIPLQASMPSGTGFGSSKYNLDPSSVSLTNPIQANFGENLSGSSSNAVRQGHFAEPPAPSFESQRPQSPSSYENQRPQSPPSYENQRPQGPPSYENQRPPGPTKKFQNQQQGQQQGQFETDYSSSYDAPFQFQQTRVSTSPPRIKTIPTRPNFHANNIPDYDDGQVESSTNTGNFAQPVLPNTYDQEEFEAFTRQRQKVIRQQQQQQQQPKEFNRFEDFIPFFDSPEENVRVPKRPKKRPTTTTPRPRPPPPPPPPVEIEEDEDEEEAPDEDYLDEIISRPSKPPPTRYRKKRPRTTSTPHVLDTDDLRDAFSSGSVQFAMAVKPDDMGTPMQRNKNQKSKSSTNRKKPQVTAYDNDMAPQVRAAQRPNDQNDRFDIISIQKSHSQTLFENTLAPPSWQSVPNGIQSRYDTNFNFPDVVARPVSQAPTPNHNFELKFKHNMNNHKYEANPDRSDTFVQSDGQSDNGIGTVKEEDTTERISTSLATISTTLWDGRILPKNHKMS